MAKMKKISCVIALGLTAIVSIATASPLISASAATSVITLEAYSYYNSSDGLGHSWIAITNDTSNTYYLGVYEMTPGETVTVGLWGNLGNAGVWYNVESYAIDELNYFNGRVSIKTTISSTQLSSVNSYISSHDYWNISYNCSCFVKDIWNMVSSDTVNCGWMVNLPSWLCDSIKSKSTYYTNRSIPTNSKIGYAHYDVLYYEVPESLEESSNSSYSLRDEEYNGLALLNTSFPEMTVEENITAQLEYIGSELTYEEYMRQAGLLE